MRVSRVKVKEGIYHCMSRVVAGEMRLGEREKEVFRKQMWSVAAFCGVEILTYCVMTNHFHVLVKVPVSRELCDGELLRRCHLLYTNDNLHLSFIEKTLEKGGVNADVLRERLHERMCDVSMFMKELKQRFSVWYNKSHDRYGVFWADRFKSVLVEGEHFAMETVAAYIDLNPVRAGLVKDPKDYRFSGYGEACANRTDAKAGVMEILGESDWYSALNAYRLVLFGKGGQSKALDKQSVDSRKVDAVLSGKAKFTRLELLRCRCRYFTDGLIIGSKAFVEDYYNKNFQHLSESRPSGSRKMRGVEMDELMVFRDLRKTVISLSECD